MKVQRVMFKADYYELGAVKYAKGQHYPVTDETNTRALAGDAELVDIEMGKDAAVAQQAAADAALTKERQATSEAEAAVRRGGDAVPVA